MSKELFIPKNLKSIAYRIDDNHYEALLDARVCAKILFAGRKAVVKQT